MGTIPRVVGIFFSGVWIVLSALNYERGVAGYEGNPWLKGFVILGIVGGPALLARLSMEEGRTRERVRGLRATICSLCRVLSIRLTAERRDELQQMDATALEALRDRLTRERRWD